jgi:hypothetical protein
LENLEQIFSLIGELFGIMAMIYIIWVVAWDCPRREKRLNKKIEELESKI